MFHIPHPILRLSVNQILLNRPLALFGILNLLAGRANPLVQRRLTMNKRRAHSTNGSGSTTISCTADGSQAFTGGVECSGDGTYLGKFTASSVSISTNGGSSWFSIPVPSGTISCLAVSSDCTKLVVGISSGLLYGSANMGATWSAITTGNQSWSGAWMSEDGSKFAATVSGGSGGIYDYSVYLLPNTISTNSTISGGQGTAVELQAIVSNQWMPVSSSGTIWAY